MAEPTQAPTRPSQGSPPGLRLWLELAALAALLLAIGVAVQAWPRLPGTVPMHFDLAGEPDGWGGRGSILVLPGSALFLYLLLTGVQRLPSHWYNYPVTITEENRERQYRLARDLVVWMKAAVLGLFAHVTVAVVRTALGEATGLGAWTVPLWLAVIFGILGVYFARALRAR